MRRRVEGAPPTKSSARFQYSRSEEYWSQATTAHLVQSVPARGQQDFGHPDAEYGEADGDARRAGRR